jgi:hypothetical protein
MTSAATRAAKANSVSEFCRTCNDAGISIPADLIVWGKLFPKEALGPRCVQHFWKQTGYPVSDLTVGQSAVYDLRVARAEVAQMRKSLGAAFSGYLGLLMDQKFEDGTSVLEVLFETSPELRAQFRRVLGVTA